MEKEIEIETNYRARYYVESIPREVIERWNTREPIPELKLPVPNEFVPENFDLYLRDNVRSRHPYIIHASLKSELWFKQDDEYRSPQLSVELEIMSTITGLGPHERISWRVFHDLLLPYLQKHLHGVQILGIQLFNWAVELTYNGLQVKLFSFNDKLSLILDRLLSKIINFADKIDEKHFEMSQSVYFQNLQRIITKDHNFQANWYRQFLQNPNSFSSDTCLKVSKILRFDDMKRSLSRAFRRIFVRGLIHGNCNEEKAMEIVDIIEKTFHSSDGLLLQETMRPRYIEIPDGSRSIYQAFNDENNTYSHSSYFQFNTEPSNLENAVGHLLFEILRKSCHEILPQTPTTVINCSFYNSHGVRGLLITARLDKEPRYFDSKIETFLRGVPNMLNNMSKENFEEYRETTLKLQELAKPSQLFELSERYWYEISNRFYDFDRTEAELNLVRSLTKNDLRIFFRKMLDEKSVRRRKLVVEVFPRDTKQARPKLLKYLPVGARKIEDEFMFKVTSTMLSLNFQPVPPKPI